MKLTDTRIIEFWEWCGFKLSTSCIKDWLKPDGSWLSLGLYSRLPPIDLNNLFKYAVPKLLEVKAKFEVLYLLKDWIEHITIYDEDPALALFWAIYEVIK